MVHYMHQNMSLTFSSEQTTCTSKSLMTFNPGQANRLKGKEEAVDKQVWYSQMSFQSEYENRLGTEHLYNKSSLSLCLRLCLGLSLSLSFSLSRLQPVLLGGRWAGLGLGTQGSSMSWRDTEMGVKKNKLNGQGPRNMPSEKRFIGFWKEMTQRNLSTRFIPGKKKVSWLDGSRKSV